MRAREFTKRHDRCRSRRLGSTFKLDGPALAVFAAKEIVGREDVGDAHVGGVVVDLFSGVKGDDTEEHDFGEAGGVVEGAGGFGLSLSISPRLRYRESARAT